MSENRENRPVRRGPMGGGPGHGPGGRGIPEKPKDFTGTVKKLVKHSLRPYLPAMAIAVLLAIAGSVLTIIGPDKVKEMTNAITAGMMSGIDMNLIATIGMTLVIYYGLSAIFSYAQSFIMATTTQRVSKNLRSDIAHKIDRLPFKFFDSTLHGDILSRVTNDVDTISQTLSQSITTMFSAVTLLIGSLIAMLNTNFLMTLTAIFSSLIGFVLMSVIMTRSQKYFSRMQSTLGEVNGHIEEIYANHNVVKAYNGEAAATETFDEINERLRKNAQKSQFLSGLMQPLMGFIGNFGYVAVCVVGGVLAVNGSIEFGVIIAFTMYVRLFTQPLSQLAQSATSLQSTAAAGERVLEFLGQKEVDSEEGKTLKRIGRASGNVDFDHVRFGYDENKTIIHDFSASAKSGQKIAIVGPTGAGKTTMVNLLMRFYEVDSGEIRIDGIPTQQLSRENVHEQFCMVLQDTWLFEGTIKENVIYAKKDVTDQQVTKACKAVGLDHFIRTLPDGYNTKLSDAVTISSGQRQLLTIARAIIEDAPLLILDEATSSVDTRTEVLIQQAMDKLMVGRTSFIIAHRLSTIRNADLILVMRDGDIVESGNHEDLLSKGGFYADLYNSQFENGAA